MNSVTLEGLTVSISVIMAAIYFAAFVFNAWSRYRLRSLMLELEELTAEEPPPVRTILQNLHRRKRAEQRAEHEAWDNDYYTKLGWVREPLEIIEYHAIGEREPNIIVTQYGPWKPRRTSE